MVRYVQPLPIDFDVNAKVLYRICFGWDSPITINRDFAAMVGVNISSTSILATHMIIPQHG